MNARRLALFLIILISVFAVAEQPTVRRDTQFPAELQSEVNTATAQPGQAVVFVTTQGVLIGNNVVVPRGAKIYGSIESVRRGVAGAGAAMQLSIDRVEWDGRSAQLNAVVMDVEPSDGDSNRVWRHLRRAVAGEPTMLDHIAVRSHIARTAFVEFASDHGDFLLRPGVCLVLWHIDPSRDPVMLARNPVLEVRSATK